MGRAACEHGAIILSAGRDGDPVPAVDLDRRKNQPTDLLLTEMVLQCLVALAGRAAIGDQGQFFDPGQNRSKRDEPAFADALIIATTI